MGEDGVDTDIPCKFEALFLNNVAGKTFFACVPPPPLPLLPRALSSLVDRFLPPPPAPFGPLPPTSSPAWPVALDPLHLGSSARGWEGGEEGVGPPQGGGGGKGVPIKKSVLKQSCC